MLCGASAASCKPPAPKAISAAAPNTSLPARTHAAPPVTLSRLWLWAPLRFTATFDYRTAFDGAAWERHPLHQMPSSATTPGRTDPKATAGAGGCESETAMPGGACAQGFPRREPKPTRMHRPKLVKRLLQKPGLRRQTPQPPLSEDLAPALRHWPQVALPQQREPEVTRSLPHGRSHDLCFDPALSAQPCHPVPYNQYRTIHAVLCNQAPLHMTFF